MNLQYSIQVPIPLNSKKKYPSNYVSTTKYNIITFLPFALVLQFRRYANLYFLTCAILQSIPLLSSLSPLSAILPLIFVLALSMAREGYEDYKRWKSDKQSNSSNTHMFRENNLCNVPWSIIRPGDLVKVYSEELVPVDMIPLYCSQSSGISYVETSSLDGEKNLKPKIALVDTQLVYNNEKKHFLGQFKADITCDEPNADVNRFTGKINIQFGETKLKSDLNHKNLILRGTKVKNTQWVVGITVYTGKDTKIMRNGCNPTTKASNIQKKVNNIILCIIVLQLLCCACSSIFCYVSCVQSYGFQQMIRSNQPTSCSQMAGITFASYFILYSTYIPISLIVSLEFVKVFQGYAMHKDKEMYCAINDRAMECHTVSINEQLGQIEYILTDKTGTLTCNKMQFKNIIVGNSVYGDDIRLHEIEKGFDFGRLTRRYSKFGASELNVKNKFQVNQAQYSHKHFDSRGINYELSINEGEDQEQNDKIPMVKAQSEYIKIQSSPTNSVDRVVSAHKRQIQLIFFIITTCHECLRETKMNKNLSLSLQGSYTSSKKSKSDANQLQEEQKSSYHGPSPDQVALLNAAKKIGFQFINTQNKVTTVIYNKKQHKFKILRVIQFDSDRKRMTVVVEWNGVVMSFVKGADTSIRKLLSPNQKYLDFITQKTKEMAKTGLRSLWFAYKMLPNLQNYEEKPVQYIEKDLTLIGATGIQDRLQDYVPETIYSLRQGNIKFIMLTGDKLQTAENIARSCKMIEEGFLIQNASKLKQGIKYITQTKNTLNQSVCPVIDGSALNFAENEEDLLQIIKISQSAVFCRVTPNQKAQIVKIVKKLGKLTLAIGDGANDVNMILEANVGIGIFGEEGTRAAQVSNYAIGQFCLLWKLLLYYGRLNYMRVVEMILYFFYKNMVFTIVQFAYSFYNLASGQSFWLSWAITFYNMVFTFFPVVLRAVFEVDVYVPSNKDTLKQLSQGSNQNAILYSYYPKMYLISQKNQMFTTLIFLSWFVLGILQGVICLMITLYSIDAPSDTSGYDSYQTGFYFAGLSAYTSVIIVVTLKLAINVRNWNLILVIGFLIPSIGAYILFCVLLNWIPIAETYFYFTDLLAMPSFYLANVLAILGMFTVDLLLFSIQATKNNFQNYFKKRALTGRRMTEANLQQLIDKFEKKSEKRSILSTSD